jgi:hypothetical protein
MRQDEDERAALRALVEGSEWGRTGTSGHGGAVESTPALELEHENGPR